MHAKPHAARQTIEALREALASFNGCNLRFGARKHRVCRRQSAIRTSCSSAKRRAATRTGRAFLCRPRRPVARQDACCHQNSTGQLLHHQHDPLAAARQPLADTAGDRTLQTVHRAACRTGQPQDRRVARQCVDQGLARHDTGYSVACAEPGRSIILIATSVHPCPADPAPGLPLAKPGTKETVMAGFPEQSRAIWIGPDFRLIEQAVSKCLIGWGNGGSQGVGSFLL